MYPLNIANNKSNMSSCNGICVKYKAKHYARHNRYENGQKRCPICALFIFYNGSRCPCCKCKLRVTPRARKLREKLQTSKKIIWH